MEIWQTGHQGSQARLVLHRQLGVLSRLRILTYRKLISRILVHSVLSCLSLIAANDGPVETISDELISI